MDRVTTGRTLLARWRRYLNRGWLTGAAGVEEQAARTMVDAARALISSPTFLRRHSAWRASLLSAPTPLSVVYRAAGRPGRQLSRVGNVVDVAQKTLFHDMHIPGEVQTFWRTRLTEVMPMTFARFLQLFGSDAGAAGASSFDRAFPLAYAATLYGYRSYHDRRWDTPVLSDIFHYGYSASCVRLARNQLLSRTRVFRRPKQAMPAVLTIPELLWFAKVPETATEPLLWALERTGWMPAPPPTERLFQPLAVTSLVEAMRVDSRLSMHIEQIAIATGRVVGNRLRAELANNPNFVELSSTEWILVERLDAWLRTVHSLAIETVVGAILNRVGRRGESIAVPVLIEHLKTSFPQVPWRLSIVRGVTAYSLKLDASYRRLCCV